MTTETKKRVLIAGGGVAALEAALALHNLAGERTDVAVIAPNSDFHYRPMVVREPFAYGAAERFPIAPIVADAGAELIEDELGWVDPAAQAVHTASGRELRYDALLLALGATPHRRFEHAITVDAATIDETLHGLLQDVEEGYTRSVAFVAPARMGWQLPLYELALMTSGRAFDAGVSVAITIVSPEESPLAIFGLNASQAVARLLSGAGIETVYSAYAEVPRSGEVVVNPGDRHLRFDRVVAMPELYGPAVRGLSVAEHGFVRVDRYAQVPHAGPVFAAGDATDFAVKHGGIAAQQADTAALAIAALVGADVEPEPFCPVIHGLLLTDGRPRYLTARITGGQGFSSEITDTPTWSPPSKIVARYLAPYLEAHAHLGARA